MKKGRMLAALGTGLMVLLGLIAVVVLFFLFAIGINNKIVRKSTAVDARWADVQNVYQRRADLIPNLVKTVEGAAGFERTTLNEVVSARANATQTKIDPSRAPDDPAQLQKFQAAQDALSSALARLLVVVERYPDLKANQNFQQLQAQLEGSENRIAVERRNYTGAVQEYNAYIQQFPASVVAGFRNFKTKPFFEATAGAERAPQVQFDFSKTPTATNR
jgi:LemA protein